MSNGGGAVSGCSQMRCWSGDGIVVGLRLFCAIVDQWNW